MTWPSLPLFMTVAGRPVILLGEGEAADAKRRLLERAGAVVVGEDADAALAIVAIEDEGEAVAAVTRLKARGVLVNAVDRPAHCDFTLPAIIDRDPVLIAIGTGGASAGLAAALRQRLEALLPSTLGHLASALRDEREEMRRRWPDPTERRQQLARAMTAGGLLDPLDRHNHEDVWDWILTAKEEAGSRFVTHKLHSQDPDDLTVRQARELASADRVYHQATVPSAILDRARADAVRIVCAAPPVMPGPGLTLYMEML
jgi:uroporphyrin-III C-methyltransferase/precorrin-2 dehydrogenase/sirohydrochlorin ferrochelatase